MEKLLKNKLLVVSAILGTSVIFASTNGDASFGELFDTFRTWLQGNLGKLLALLGFVGTFIIYMMTHKGSVLFIGIIVSLIAGGMIGISQTMFEAGKQTFQVN